MGPSSAMSFDDKDRCMLCSLTFESTKEIKERAPGDRPTCGIFHACCYDMVEPELIETLTWVTSPAYETTVEEFRRRRQWLRRNLASQLHLVYRGRHLNADVCYEIAGHLLSCYSVMMARGMLPDPKKVKWFNTVTLAREMWCRRIDYEGLSYVAKLSSTRDEGDDSMTAIRCEAGCEPECLITAENYLGIVDVRLATYSELSALEEEPGIWWRTMPLFAGARITLETDGVKLRRWKSGYIDNVVWSSPPPTRAARVHPFFHQEPSLWPTRMTSFIVNDPRATGYTLFWDHGPKYIHTHLAGEDTAALYEQFADNDVLYMPVDAGELVTEIWQRTLYQPYQWAIGFLTNKGRVFVAGAHSEFDDPGNFRLVERLGETPCRVYFENLHGQTARTKALAFSTPLPEVHRDSRFPYVRPDRAHIPLLRGTWYHFNCHVMEHVEAITPCIVHLDKPRVTGVILHDSGGRRVGLGSVRLDCLRDRLVFGDEPSWFLGFAEDEDAFDWIHVRCVGVGPPPSVAEMDRDVVHVMRLPRSGRIEWAWIRNHRVVCDGKTSPAES